MEKNVLTLLSPLFAFFSFVLFNFWHFYTFQLLTLTIVVMVVLFSATHHCTATLPFLHAVCPYYLPLLPHMEQFMKRHNDVMLHILQCYSHFPYNLLPHWGKDYSDFDQFTWLDHYTVQWNSSGQWPSIPYNKNEEKWSNLSYAKITEIGIDIPIFLIAWMMGL